MKKSESAGRSGAGPDRGRWTDRCVDCDWCRSGETGEDEELITRGDSYICLRLGRRVTQRQLWGTACRHFIAIR